MLEKIKPDIYRIIIPFEDIYTSAFILTCKNEAAIVDSGSSAGDAEVYIIPEIKKLDVKVRYIVSTHSHGDHIGGRDRLKDEYPQAVYADFSGKNNWNDGDMIFNRFKLLNFRGHSLDGLALYDIETKTLLTGDAVQQHGVGRYTNGISDKSEYSKDIERIRKTDIDTLIASHSYSPCGYLADGKEQIEKLLSCCLSEL